MAATLYHGGVPGLDPGDQLLPGAEVGVSSARTVKLTPSLIEATSQAARWPGGDVYEVEVETTDPPPWSGWALLRAVGPAVVSRVVRRRVFVPGAMPRPELSNVRPIKRRRSDG